MTFNGEGVNECTVEEDFRTEPMGLSSSRRQREVQLERVTKERKGSNGSND